MARYTTTKCGVCGAIWENMTQGTHSSIGPPLVKCRKCLSLNRTNRVLYRDASASKKVFFWLGQFVSLIFIGVYLVFLVCIL